jgi:hypothetical protein
MGCTVSTVSRSVYIIEDQLVEDPQQSTPKLNRGKSYLGTRRRHSDVSLRTILLDPTIYHSFRKFLQQDLCEEVFLFWIEVDQYNSIEQPKLQREKAAHIYETYIKQGAAQSIDLDKTTKDSIADSLAYSKGRVNQADTGKMRAAFELAHIKVFTRLKFDFMPRFLTSEAFSHIGGESHKDDASLNKLQLASEGHDVELKHCFDHPVGSPSTHG